MAVFVFAGFGGFIGVKILGSNKKLADDIVDGIFMGDSIGERGVVHLNRSVIFYAEAEVDGFVAGGPTVDHGVLVETRAGFD